MNGRGKNIEWILIHEWAHESLAHLRTDSAMKEKKFHTFDYYKRYVVLWLITNNNNCSDPFEPYR